MSSRKLFRLWCGDTCTCDALLSDLKTDYEVWQLKADPAGNDPNIYGCWCDADFSVVMQELVDKHKLSTVQIWDLEYPDEECHQKTETEQPDEGANDIAGVLPH